MNFLWFAVWFELKHNAAEYSAALHFIIIIIIIIIVYPLTARVIGASQMISQPVSSIFLCSQLPPGTCMANSRPVHSLMLSSHLFFCLPCLLPPFTVPCKMVLALYFSSNRTANHNQWLQALHWEAQCGQDEPKSVFGSVPSMVTTFARQAS